MNKSNIILIGMPNSGKSTVGRYLSELLKKSFIDTDELISKAEGKAPREIVTGNGLKYFLNVQENIIMGIDSEDCIVATGGSVIYSDAAMKHLDKIGMVVFLDLDCKEVERRISSERRFARNQDQTLIDLYNERLPLYLKYADIVIDTNSKSVDKIAAEIINSRKDL